MPSVKNIGKPCAGKPHARFDEEGQGRTCSLVRLKVRNARGVKVPFRENAFRPVTDRNCGIGR